MSYISNVYVHSLVCVHLMIDCGHPTGGGQASRDGEAVNQYEGSVQVSAAATCLLQTADASHEGGAHRVLHLCLIHCVVL